MASRTAFTTSIPLSKRITPPLLTSLHSPLPTATFRITYCPPHYSLKLPLRALHTNPPTQSVAPSASVVPPEHRLTTGVRARTLVHICSSGTLCTSSARHSGVPFGSHVDYILDTDGQPVFLLAKNAAHTTNLSLERRCSLFCQPGTSFGAGQAGCRATLVGEIHAMEPGEELDELREQYIERHSHASDALVFPEFSFYRMRIHDVFFVGGYGVVSQWVQVSDYEMAAPDPLAFDAPAIVSDLNARKTRDLKRLCKVFLQMDDVERCTMTGLDRLGFDLRVRDSKGEIKEYRVAFREVVSNRFDAQSALVKAFQEAWERENGFDETWEGENMRPTALYYANH